MDLYGEIILDHFKNPRHCGLVKDAQITGEDNNPLCGDKVKTSLKVNQDGVIEDFGFEGDGCAISVASTSILGENLPGMKLKDLENLSNEELYELIAVPISPGRVKCALLGLTCLKKSIKLYQAEHGQKEE
jgi:nitrogen fixation NifU-like protein